MIVDIRWSRAFIKKPLISFGGNNHPLRDINIHCCFHYIYRINKAFQLFCKFHFVMSLHNEDKLK